MRKHLLAFIIILCYTCSFAQVPVWNWAKDANSSSPETLLDVSNDPSSTNVYVGGSFKGNLSSKYGPAFSTSSGNMDALVAKYDALGNVLWAFKIAGVAGDEEVKGVAVDPSGNVYVTGNFNTTTDFDPSGLTFNLTTAGGTDGFLAKYSPSGTFLWAVKFGGSNNENSYKMAADANGIYLTGAYESNPATFYSYSSAVTKTPFFNDSGPNMFGAKYDSNGIVQWVVSGGSNLDDYGIKVIADAANIYFLGIYYHDISFKSATNVTGPVMQDEQHNEANTFILQVTQAGALGWQTNITSSQGGKDVLGWSIAQDASNLYVTGQSDGNINFKYPTPAFAQTISGSNDLFLAKLTKATGTFLWNTSATGNGSGDQVGRALEVNGSGNIILGGQFTAGLNYSGVGGPNFTATAQDLFITGYNNAGTFLWSFKAGGNNTENFNGLAADNFGNIYLAGDHGGAATFGSVTLGSGGNADIYLAKLACPAVSNNTISASQTICSGNTPSTLAGSLPVNASLYTWQMSTNNLTWSNASGTFTNQNYSPPSLTATTYYRRIVNGAGCLGIPGNTIQLTVMQPPSISSAGNNQTVCISSATLNANTPVNGTGAWSVITGTGNITNSANPSSQITGLSFGLNSFAWTISNAPCPSSTSTITIVRDIPPSSFAGSTQTVCSANATLAATYPPVGSGAWSVITGTANITATNDPSSQVTGLSNGTNIFLWTVSNGVCPTATSVVTITQDIMPSSLAGNTQTVCSSNATLAATNPTVGNGTWYVITGTATITSSNNPSSQVTALNNGLNTFLWTVSNGVCPTATSAVNILRDIAPSSFAGTSQTVCTSSITLNATTPPVGNGVWSVISGTGNITAINNPGSEVTALSIGTNAFAWTVSNGVCVPATSTVVVMRDQVPDVSNAGTDFTVCASTATLNANNPSIGTGNWSVLTGTATITSTTSNLPGAINLSTGVNEFVWTITNGSCPASTSTVSVFAIQPLPNAFAGIDQQICSDLVTLNANNVFGYGNWLTLAGTGSVINTNSYNTNVSGLSAGNNIFVWIVTKDNCPTTSDTVIVIRDELPTTSLAGQDQTVCGPLANLSANAPLIGSGQWQIVNGNGNISNTNSQQTSVTGISGAGNIFAWIITNGVCPASIDSLTIISDQFPSDADAGADKQVCGDQTNLSATAPLIGTGSWILISGNCTFTSTTATGIQVNLPTPGASILRWTVKNGVCPDKTDDVEITRIEPPSAADAGADANIESSFSKLNAITPVIGSGKWSVIEGSGDLENFNDPNTSVKNLAFGNNIIRWTTYNGNCPENTDDVLIYVKPLFVPNGFSPNGDGFNDKFVITSLDYYSSVKLSVFNRWGALLYTNTNYKNDWAGVNSNNEQLTDDTYYYLIEIPGTKSLTGFIVIKQNR